jgi:hypothetical protein
MEPEGSLSCSQEPFTGPYSEPVKSNPTQIYFQIRYNIESGASCYYETSFQV